MLYEFTDGVAFSVRRLIPGGQTLAVRHAAHLAYQLQRDIDTYLLPESAESMHVATVRHERIEWRDPWETR